MADEQQNSPAARARRLADAYARLPQVEAVALGGSQAGGRAAAGSDIDLYVYLAAELPLATRAAIAGATAVRAEIGNQFWEPGDEWVEADGLVVDVMFRDTRWIADQLDQVLVRHAASVGYTTCLWHNVLASQPLFDRRGWFAALQERARAPYPEALRRAVVAKNHPILRRTISSYRHQLEQALGRDDRVSLSHRAAALLASYFDVLFAVNRLPHPGEKRLLAYAEEQCDLTPPAMRDDVSALLAAPPGELLAAVDRLVDGLDALLRAAGLLDG